MGRSDKQGRVLCTLQGDAETGFLIGTRGRNLALIAHRSRAVLWVVKQKQEVHLLLPTTTPNLLLAWRMMIAFLTGGALRWCVTPAQSKRCEPTAELKALAATVDCDLELLPSRRGHTCLLLLPRLADEASAETTLAHFRLHMPAARATVLDAISLLRPPLEL
jgi:hypothetical protein